MTASCMGGWCAKRDHCAHYHAASPDHHPAERLCIPGHDGEGLFLPAPLDATSEDHTMPNGKAPAFRQDQLAQHLTDEGLTIEQIMAVLQMCRTQCVRIVTAMCKAGRAFRFRGKLQLSDKGSSRYALFFKTEAARDAYAADYEVRMADHRREVQRECCRAWQLRNSDKRREERVRNRAQYTQRKAEQRARDKAAKEAEQAAARQSRDLAAAERAQAKLRQRLDREAAEAEKRRQKAEAKSQRERLRAETKALGQLGKRKGTATALTPKPIGPALLPGEPDISQAKITRFPTPRGRFEPEPGFVGEFTRLGIGRLLEAA